MAKSKCSLNHDTAWELRLCCQKLPDHCEQQTSETILSEIYRRHIFHYQQSILSEGNMQCQMNKQSSTCDYLNTVHYLIGSNDDDHVFGHDAMSQ